MINCSIPQIDKIFQRVKEIPFPEVQRVFHGGEVERNKICCPFHQDKTPSFHVYHDGFKCYGCGESGDSIIFVAKLHNLQSLDAVKAIADEFSIPYQERALSWKERLKMSQAKEERLRQKKVEVAFKEWVKQTQEKTRILTEAIRREMGEMGVDIDDKLLDLIHELPRLEHWADILESGTDEEKIELYRDVELRRWIA